MTLNLSPSCSLHPPPCRVMNIKVFSFGIFVVFCKWFPKKFKVFKETILWKEGRKEVIVPQILSSPSQDHPYPHPELHPGRECPWATHPSH